MYASAIGKLIMPPVDDDEWQPVHSHLVPALLGMDTDVVALGAMLKKTPRVRPETVSAIVTWIALNKREGMTDFLRAYGHNGKVYDSMRPYYMPEYISEGQHVREIVEHAINPLKGAGQDKPVLAVFLKPDAITRSQVPHLGIYKGDADYNNDQWDGYHGQDYKNKQKLLGDIRKAMVDKEFDVLILNTNDRIIRPSDNDDTYHRKGGSIWGWDEQSHQRTMTFNKTDVAAVDIPCENRNRDGNMWMRILKDKDAHTCRVYSGKTKVDEFTFKVKKVEFVSTWSRIATIMKETYNLNEEGKHNENTTCVGAAAVAEER